MTSLVATERSFPVYPRGRNRDDMLAIFRSGLSKIINPDTKVVFTQEEIAAATSDLSKYFAEADAIDLVLLGGQARALYLAEQGWIDRASSEMLNGQHGPQWEPNGKLAANGGAGTATVSPGLRGTTYVGSSIIPDEAAVQVRDPATGLRFQLIESFTVSLTVAEDAVLKFKAIDTGPATNVDAGVEFEFVKNQPLSATGLPVVDAKFTGGLSAETDAQFAKRMMDRIRHKPAAGNPSHFRDWARRSTVAVEDCFIYACAFHAGSVLCVPTGRRTASGPAGRHLSSGDLLTVRQFLTPPNSPVVPRPPYVLVVDWVEQPTDAVIELDMRVQSATGWTDRIAWPSKGTGATMTNGGDNAATFIDSVTSQTSFAITRGVGGDDLPTGVTAPALMVWDEASATFEKLDIQSVTFSSGDDFDVVLNVAPTHTLTPLDIISPDNGARTQIAEGYQGYFDSLGPGEVVDLATDDRAHRAVRFVPPNEEYPQRAGSSVGTFLRDVLGNTLAGEVPTFFDAVSPAVPSDPEDGPAMVVSGALGVYPAA